MFKVKVRGLGTVSQPLCFSFTSESQGPLGQCSWASPSPTGRGPTPPSPSSSHPQPLGRSPWSLISSHLPLGGKMPWRGADWWVPRKERKWLSIAEGSSLRVSPSAASPGKFLPENDSSFFIICPFYQCHVTARHCGQSKSCLDILDGRMEQTPAHSPDRGLERPDRSPGLPGTAVPLPGESLLWGRLGGSCFNSAADRPAVQELTDSGGARPHPRPRPTGL